MINSQAIIYETQDPKYGIKNNCLVNAASGEAIPNDEPIFVLRGKDKNSPLAIKYYHSLCDNKEHQFAVNLRYQHFLAYHLSHPDNVKESDMEQKTKNDFVMDCVLEIKYGDKASLCAKKSITVKSDATHISVGIHEEIAPSLEIISNEHSTIRLAPIKIPSSEDLFSLKRLAVKDMDYLKNGGWEILSIKGNILGRSPHPLGMADLLIIDESALSSIRNSSLFVLGKHIASSTDSNNVNIQEIARNLAIAMNCSIQYCDLTKKQLAESIACKPLSQDEYDCYLSDFSFDDMLAAVTSVGKITSTGEVLSLF